MKNNIFPILYCICCFISCGKSTGNIDNKNQDKKPIESEVKIGNQTWTTYNLNVDKFQNGDTIPKINSREEWIKAGDNHQPAWCYHDFDPENGKKYGRLYNWYTVNDPRGIAPKGWHIPSQSEWNELINFLGKSDAGKKMKVDWGWAAGGNGTNESGFSATPGGLIDYAGNFDMLGVSAYWWSTTPHNDKKAKYNGVAGIIAYVESNAYEYGYGMSIRCIKNK